MLNFIKDMDLVITELINSSRFAILDQVLPYFSETWLFVLAIIVLILLLHKRYNKYELATLALAIGLAAGLSNISCDLIKSASGRLRPYQSVENTYYQDAGVWKQISKAELAPAEQRGSSFCSAHVANTTAVVVIIIFFINIFKTNFLLFLPLLVAWSRIYLGKHFFSDTLFAYFVGLCSATLVYLCLVSLRKYLNKKYISL